MMVVLPSHVCSLPNIRKKEDTAQREKTLTMLCLSASGMSLIFVCTNISTPWKNTKTSLCWLVVI